MQLSLTDRRLLAELQSDTTRNQSELAELVGMSRTSCWRRIRDFEEAGLIEQQVALLNPKVAGFNIQVLLLVAMTEHTEENRRNFERHVSLLPEVMECFSVSGDRDYLQRTNTAPRGRAVGKLDICLASCEIFHGIAFVVLLGDE
jgi:Lrp/AsnC family transcriptional regulator